jgi:hypothetical protein
LTFKINNHSDVFVDLNGKNIGMTNELATKVKRLLTQVKEIKNLKQCFETEFGLTVSPPAKLKIKKEKGREKGSSSSSTSDSDEQTQCLKVEKKLRRK